MLLSYFSSYTIQHHLKFSSAGHNDNKKKLDWKFNLDKENECQILVPDSSHPLPYRAAKHR